MTKSSKLSKRIAKKILEAGVPLITWTGKILEFDEVAIQRSYAGSIMLGYGTWSWYLIDCSSYMPLRIDIGSCVPASELIKHKNWLFGWRNQDKKCEIEIGDKEGFSHERHIVDPARYRYPIENPMMTSNKEKKDAEEK